MRRNYQDEIITLDEKKTVPVIKLGISSVQGTREKQQDAVLGYNMNCSCLAAVCDGMGGLEGGEIASSTAIEVLERDFSELEEEEDVYEFLIYEARKIDRIIEKLRDDDGELLEAGTTVVAAVIRGREVYWMSAGDSKIFYIRNGRMFPLTREHNYRLSLDILKQRGLISEQDYLMEAEKGESLISYLGMGNLRLIDGNSEAILLERGDRILLCSDGLYKNMDEAEILSVLQKYRDVQETANALTFHTMQKNKNDQDNTSVVLIEYS